MDCRTPDYTVAIFLPAVHSAMDEIAQGFKETIVNQSEKKYHFVMYNANGNNSVMRAQAHAIINANYNLVFTVGATCTQTLYEFTKKRELSLPIVFSALDDPVKMGVIQSMQSSHNNLTGVISTHLYEQQIEELLQIKPAVKKLLLVYNPAHGNGLENEKNILKNVLEKKDITLTTVEIANANEITQKVSTFLSGVDVILILTDHTAVTGLPALATLCERHQILLYASDLNSGDKGAALAFGVLEYEYGTLAASLALNILEKNKAPAALPIVRVEKQYIKINIQAAYKQGLVLSADQLTQLSERKGIII